MTDRRHAGSAVARPAAKTRPFRIAVVLVTAVTATGCQSTPARQAGPLAPPATGITTSPAPVPVEPDAQDGLVGAQPASPDPGAQHCAEAFTRAWARPQLTSSEWLSGLATLATPSYRALLATVDPANVPATLVVGPATVVLSTIVRSDFDVPTDAGPIRVTCVRQQARWLVATVEDAQPQ